MDGREYAPDKAGEIIIPYTERPKSQSVILKNGDFAVLESFNHKGEAYSLQSGIFIEREQLVAKKQAKAVFRPSLTLNGARIAPGLIENLELDVSARNQERDGGAAEPMAG